MKSMDGGWIEQMDEIYGNLWEGMDGFYSKDMGGKDRKCGKG